MVSEVKDYSGLSQAQVDERVAQGKVNISQNLKSKSVKRIFYDNICTLFNLVNLVLLLALCLVGSFKNVTFVIIVFLNMAIGIFQEIRSKRSVDKLTILSEKKVSVLRNGEIQEISKESIVLDDIIVLSRGDQIPADCIVFDGECKVNESLLTGEADLIQKKKNDSLLSGSFIACGVCYAKVTAVGKDSYAARINAEAKYIKKVNSQIVKSFNFIVKLCSIIIFPIGAGLFISQYFAGGGNLQDTVIKSVGLLLGMIPKGMILLTSTVLALTVIRLSQKKVLAQDLYCVESLARVDVLCLDKTGTLTADKMNVHEIISFGSSDDEINTALASVVEGSDEINATLYAIQEYTKGYKTVKCKKIIPFASETKWSGGVYEDGNSYIIGAAEFVFADRLRYARVFDEIEKIGETVRILVLAKSEGVLESGKLPENLTPMALVLIKDLLRANVCDTINYFKEQGVVLKVISGDSVKTVKNIALETGIEGAENAVDMTTVTTEEELFEVSERCNVFGRVTPSQKKQLVMALKKHGHFVAMTGDGVNDVLALKESDCSVAMASGSDAARNVSQLVLVNDDFASMPHVVEEGRKTINNVERSSSLYMIKTIYSIVLAIFFIFFSTQAPFSPVQLTLVGAFATAIPSFVLALQPNKNRIDGNFTFNIIARAGAAAFCIIMNIILLSVMKGYFNVSEAEVSTISLYLTALSTFLLVLRLSLPLNLLRSLMLIVSVGGFSVGCIFFGEFFDMVLLHKEALIFLSILAAVTIIVFNVLYSLSEHFVKRLNRKNKAK